MSAAPGGLVATKDVELGGLDAHAKHHATHHLNHELKTKEDVEEEAQERCVITEHKLSLPDLAKEMDVDFEVGLSSAEAEIRNEKYGLNSLTEEESVHWLIKMLMHVAGGFSLLLWAGGILCFIVYALDGSVPDLTLGIVLVVVVTATGIFSYVQEVKSEATLASFQNLTPDEAMVKRDGAFVKMNAVNLTYGDVVKLEAGEKIPADVIIIESTGMKVNNASLTGESEPLKRVPECTDDMPTRSKNVAFFGTHVEEGVALGCVVKIGDDTTMGEIARSVQLTQKAPPLMQLELERFVHIISGIAITIGVVFFICGVTMGYSVKRALIFTIGIIVANVPEGLLATVTVALTITATNMAACHVHVKSTLIVESLGSVTCIASDKTGTLTQNTMKVVNAILPDGTVRTQSHPKTASVKIDDEQPIKLDEVGTRYAPHATALIEAAGLCNHVQFYHKKDAKTGENIDIVKRMTEGGNASEAALLKFSHANGNVYEYREDFPEIACVPFNSNNKFMVTIHKTKTAGQFRLIIKGAPERVMERCQTVMNVESGSETALTPAIIEAANESNKQLAQNGERVLAFGELILKGYDPNFEFDTEDIAKTNFPMDKFKYIGMLALEDPPRPEVPGAVLNCQTASIKVVMVTGDHPLTARSIANKINILTEEMGGNRAQIYSLENKDRFDESKLGVVVTGDVLKHFEDKDWEYVLSRKGIVFARTLPQQKQEIVNKLQDEATYNEVVAVTGDGVNDSPALKAARVGIAMGSGAPVAHDASDLILKDDNFASIVDGVREGRLIFANLKKSIAYTLTSNIPEILPFLAQIILKIPLGMTTIMILCVDLGTDILPAISFAYEFAEGNIMNIPPRDRNTEFLVTPQLISFSYLQIGIIQAFASFTVFFDSLERDGFDEDTVLRDELGFEWDEEDSSDCFPSTKTDEASGCATSGERRFALRRAQTAYLAAIVMCQIGCGIACKTREYSIFQHGFYNAVFNYGLIQETGLILMLVYIPGLQSAFATEEIYGVSWALALPFAFCLWGYDEMRKMLIRSLPPDHYVRKTLFY